MDSRRESVRNVILHTRPDKPVCPFVSGQRVTARWPQKGKFTSFEARVETVRENDVYLIFDCDGSEVKYPRSKWSWITALPQSAEVSVQSVHTISLS